MAHSPRTKVKIVVLSESTNEMAGTRWRKVRVVSTGEVFQVGICRGKPVRIPYKPRGQNRGYKYVAEVRGLCGKKMISDRFECSKDCGIERALRVAGALGVADFRAASAAWFKKR